MRYYVLQAKDLKSFSSDVKIIVDVKSNYAGEDQADDEEVYALVKNDFYNNKTVQDSKELKELVKQGFETVYNEDIYAAGYNKFVFGKYIWWESLLALVLVEIVCGSFVLVWNAEEEKEAAKNSKKRK